LNITLTKQIGDYKDSIDFDIGQLQGNPPNLYDVMLKINETDPNSNFNSTIDDNVIKSLGGKEESDGMSWFVYKKTDKGVEGLDKGK